VLADCYFAAGKSIVGTSVTAKIILGRGTVSGSQG
jgi:hypothetical protein